MVQAVFIFVYNFFVVRAGLNRPMDIHRWNGNYENVIVIINSQNADVGLK